jgi:translation initiation factor 4G
MTSISTTSQVDPAGAVNVRDASPEDAEFLAWVMLTAARSHLPRGVWDHLLAWDEQAVLDFLSALSQRDPVHLFHWSRFIIAEVDGQPAAALSGFDPEVEGFDVYTPIAVSLYLERGGTEPELEEFMVRGADLSSAMAPADPGAWVVESVATAPAFRRRGLVDRLLDDIVARGRDAGHRTAQISVFIGNEPARNAYVKRGFRPAGETRTAEWERAIGCPGIERLVMAI